MSGRSSVMMKAKEIGVDLDARSPELKDFLAELKQLEFRGYGYEAADASFKLLLNRFLKGKKNDFELIDYRVMVSHQSALKRTVSEATVQVKIDDQIHHTVAEANGPVGALDDALRRAIAPVFPEIMDVELIDLAYAYWKANTARTLLSVFKSNPRMVVKFGALSVRVIT